MATEPMLLHFRISHYNEKVRWALDHKKWPHRRETLLPDLGCGTMEVTQPNRSIIRLHLANGLEGHTVIATCGGTYDDRPRNRSAMKFQ